MSCSRFFADDLDRVTAEARTGIVPFARSYTYDLANNVTQVDSSAFATYDAGNKISSLTGGTISFDGNGRLRSLSHPTIGSGSFIWNSSDKMTSQTVSGVTSTYKYDHRGLRLVSFQASEGQWVYYVFSGDSLIGEVRSNGNQKAYTWGADGVVSIRDVTSGTSRWLHYGPQGETRYLTNSSGVITDSYNYSAYGVLTATTGSSYNSFRYGGKVGYYSYGGLILAGQRWYHPGLMRWFSRDPILYDGGDNVYAYVEGNPVGYTDRTGLIAGADDVAEIALCLAHPVACVVSGATAAGITYCMQPGHCDFLPSREEVTGAVEDAIRCYNDLRYCFKPPRPAAERGDVFCNKDGREDRPKREKYKTPENPNKRKGADERGPEGLRPRNSKHPNAEEHSRTPKGTPFFPPGK
ncbi:MAG: RHS repeat-associated core domain-containing protein [bacterium]|nr:RHS repeat-associated core domain-containing protein [bacterium]